jgi:hypothetical protein
VSDVDEIINPGLLKEIGKQKVSLYANRGSWKHKLRQHMRVWSMFSNDFIKKKKEGLSLAHSDFSEVVKDNYSFEDVESFKA